MQLGCTGARSVELAATKAAAAKADGDADLWNGSEAGDMCGLTPEHTRQALEALSCSPHEDAQGVAEAQELIGRAWGPPVMQQLVSGAGVRTVQVAAARAAAAAAEAEAVAEEEEEEEEVDLWGGSETGEAEETTLVHTLHALEAFLCGPNETPGDAAEARRAIGGLTPAQLWALWRAGYTDLYSLKRAQRCTLERILPRLPRHLLDLIQSAQAPSGRSLRAPVLGLASLSAAELESICTRGLLNSGRDGYVTVQGWVLAHGQAGGMYQQTSSCCSSSEEDESAAAAGVGDAHWPAGVSSLGGGTEPGSDSEPGAALLLAAPRSSAVAGAAAAAAAAALEGAGGSDSTA